MYAFVLILCSEISRSQDRLTDLLQDVYISCPQYRGLLRMIMSTVGRGGEGDVGQRIRDEILVIQVILNLFVFTVLYSGFQSTVTDVDKLFITAEEERLQRWNDGRMAPETA